LRRAARNSGNSAAREPSCRRYLDWLVAQGYETTEPERELLGDLKVD
jgi:hypothetical protein